jgi:hypothetical protein
MTKEREDLYMSLTIISAFIINHEASVVPAPKLRGSLAYEFDF